MGCANTTEKELELKKEKPLKCLQTLCEKVVPDLQISKIVYYSISKRPDSPRDHHFSALHSYGANFKDEQQKDTVSQKFEETMAQNYLFGSSKAVSFLREWKDAKRQMNYGSKYNYVQFENVMSVEGQDTQIVCNQGEITVIEFWTPWYLLSFIY